MANSVKDKTANGFKICSFNCNGLNNYKKRKDVFDFLRTEKNNIYLLQETHLPHKNENFIRSAWGFSAFLAGCDTNKNGVAILFSNNFEYKIHSIHRDPEGCYLIMDIEFLKKRLTLVNVYGPSSGDCPFFLDKISKIIDDIGNELIVSAGDWNVVLDVKLDCRNYQSTTNRPRTRKKIYDLMLKHDLFDVFRTLYTEKRKYTWRKFNSIKQARLDFFLISDCLMPDVMWCEIGKSYRSDHSLVTLSFKQDSWKKDRQYWKFNNSLLKDTVYIKEIKNVILNVKKDYALPVYDHDNIDRMLDTELSLLISDQLFFEMLLLKIREKTISYSSFKKKTDSKFEKELEDKIKNLSDNLDESDVEKLETLKIELQQLRDKRTEGMIIRSRVQWLQHGEKPSKYFCNLENRNFIDRSMVFLERDDGQVIYDQDDILKEVQTFYESLYTKQEVTEVNVENMLFDVQTLNVNESNMLEGELTFAEICAALKNMKNNKSPGPDGFTVEFFKFFFNDIGHFLVRSVNEGFSKQCLSVTQQQGVIICLPKEGKPKHFVKNWRPISLLNVAYKITSSAIAARIKHVLHLIINEDQKGFLKGRYIGDNVRKIYDLLVHTEKENIPGLLLTIDFAKAFDSVSWSFLQKALRFFNFGPDLRQWISTLYHNASSCVSVNGQYSKWFGIRRGVRQGDPISPYLFLICAEIMSIMIRQNGIIKGIKINAQETLLAQFADDTSICLDGSEDSFKECIRVLNLFSNISGLTINTEKTNVIWIGSKKHSSTKFLRDENFCWNPGIFKILGISFCTDIDRICEINFENKLETIKRTLHKWKKRQLTPFGKITVIKTLALPQLTYLFMNLPDPPLHFLKDVEKSIFEFLWNNKPSKIKRSIVCRSYREGGMQMVDIFSYLSALKLSCLRRLKNNVLFKDSICNLIPEIERLDTLGEEYVHCVLQHCNNPFWRDVLKHFKQLCAKCHASDAYEFMSECIHYNPNFLRGRKTIYVKEWVDNDIIFVSHLYNVVDKCFFTYHEFMANFPHVRKTHFLMYEGILNSIRECAAKNNFHLVQRSHTVQTKVWYVILKGNKSVQSTLLTSNSPHSALKKWNTLYRNVDWSKTFYFCSKLTDLKLKWFQMRLIYRLLPTRKFLHDRKIVNDPTCSSCNLDIQTIQHLLWHCNIAQEFWRSLRKLLAEKCIHLYNLNLTEEFILFGYNHSVADSVFDYIIVNAKYYIYVCYMKANAPNLKAFMALIKRRYCEVKYMACVVNKQVLFDTSWEPYSQLVQ